MPNATSVWDFTDGEILTAAKLDDVNCGIHVFANSTARTSAYGGTGERTLVEGEFSYLADTNQTQYYDGSTWLTLGGKLGQVVSATKTDTFTTSSTTFADVTGLSVTITPTSTSSQVLVFGSITGCHDVGVSEGGVRMVRDSTAIMVGDTAGSRTSGFQIQTASGNLIDTIAAQVLDSPATTSATTYKWQVMNAAAGTFYVNRSKTDTNAAYTFRAASSITVIEVLP